MLLVPTLCHNSNMSVLRARRSERLSHCEARGPTVLLLFAAVVAALLLLPRLAAKPCNKWASQPYKATPALPLTTCKQPELVVQAVKLLFPTVTFRKVRVGCYANSLPERMR